MWVRSARSYWREKKENLEWVIWIGYALLLGEEFKERYRKRKNYYLPQNHLRMHSSVSWGKLLPHNEHWLFYVCLRKILFVWAVTVITTTNRYRVIQKNVGIVKMFQLVMTKQILASHLILPHNLVDFWQLSKKLQFRLYGVLKGNKTWDCADLLDTWRQCNRCSESPAKKVQVQILQDQW